jgi:hypothetical protein
MSCIGSVNDALSSLFQAKQNKVATQIGMAVQRKSLDATQLQGQAAVQLIQSAAEIAKQLGQGLHFDARA